MMMDRMVPERSFRSPDGRPPRSARARGWPEHAALVRLAETTATALDEVVAGDEKRYVVAQLARAHLLTVEALLSVYDEDHLDPFAAFVAGMSTPSVRTDPDLRARANPHSLRGVLPYPQGNTLTPG